MHSRNPLVFLALLALVILPLRPAQAEDKAAALQKVLRQLDTAANGFHTTTATVEFDSIQTDPIYDKDVMTGTAFYERNSHLEMAVHFANHIVDGKSHPTGKAYVFSGGMLRVSDTGKEIDAKPVEQASKYESYFVLGFGAGGKDLEEKWTIKYLGKETLDGIAVDVLELVAKDPTVRKNIAKVTVWMDTARAVSLKVIFDEGEGQSYICHYSNIKVNQPLPKTAFNFDK
jgi:outer membrane lipoprotein-sorting protein